MTERSRDVTTEETCLDALREAAARLGTSPTKAEYEALAITPSSSTIMRVVGGWNEAKERAGLETYRRGEFGGSTVEPKPDWVDLPDDEEWADLSPHQRWYRKNRERQAGKKARRRADLRRWLHDYKDEHCSCRRCGESAPACLDFHHVGEKTMGVARMVNRGFARDAILDEIERCEVVCANCHRKLHYEPPVPDAADSE